MDGEPEPFPYTKVRDWIALLAQADLSDGAFRLYYISRSVIWENTKGGPPPRPVVEITYEEYARIMGRSARTISRFADDLLKVGLWEELERASRSVRVPGKPRPQVQTVLTIRVHDYPLGPGPFTGPRKTWDVLGAIREGRRRAHDAASVGSGGHVSAGQCDRTDLSTQSDQPNESDSSTHGATVPDSGRADEGVPAGQCDRTDLSVQSDQLAMDVGAGEDHQQDRRDDVSPAEIGDPPGRTGMTDLSRPATNLSAVDDVCAGHRVREGVPKKKGEEEKPSLPPSPSQHGRESLADELAMFSAPTVEIVGQLYEKTVATNGLPPLSAPDRAALARRIEGRLAEGWSPSRVRAVLTGGSLVGVKMPGRLWAGRLDDMPAYRPLRGGEEPNARRTAHERSSGDGHRARSVVTNDCSTMPDPNAGQTRYEVPDGRGVRMTVRWADDRRVLPWCGRCSSDSRCLAPRTPGALLRACPECHPEPHAFPPEPGDPDGDSTTPPDGVHKGRQTPNGQPAATRPDRQSSDSQRPLSVPATEGH